MNLRSAVSPVRTAAFRAWRLSTVMFPGGRIRAFGEAAGQIGAIIVVNMDRQPTRWRRVTREIGRFRTSEGTPLLRVTRRLAAVDARDGRAVAATADVDPLYRIGDQLRVLPDARLAQSFAEEEPVRMTRQEVAVAQSHVEVWKAVASGTDNYVLVLEDDAWFMPGAATAINRGWHAALGRCAETGGPNLLYLSYLDLGGRAVRDEVCDVLFRPERGLLFLSGYVISREGAAALLRAMPVVGPVDLWINYRFDDLGALALAKPVIAQRHDGGSDNTYSILPYLARAGIVDARESAEPPDLSRVGPVLAWTSRPEHEGLATALSMLGLRVRAFDGDEEPMDRRGLEAELKTFDALIDAPLASDALAAVAEGRAVILLEADSERPAQLPYDQLLPRRSAVLGPKDKWSWDVLCEVLGVAKPAEAFPVGAHRRHRLFRDDRPVIRRRSASRTPRNSGAIDGSPWVLPPSRRWLPAHDPDRSARPAGSPLAMASMKYASMSFPSLAGTFPGNLASFSPENLRHDDDGAQLVIHAAAGGPRPYRSAAFASESSFTYGRFEAEIRAARGSGLITGFFLHRATPRQEIDIEFGGGEPRQLLVNVYFNPGDDGTAMGYGYRGSPYRIDLGFDATEAFHRYGIDWQHDRIAWLVDGKVVHERISWDPTPIPHLPMRIHANLWAPRSGELAGRIDQSTLPASAAFRNVVVSS